MLLLQLVIGDVRAAISVCVLIITFLLATLLVGLHFEQSVR